MTQTNQNKDYRLSRIIGNLRHKIVTECVPILIKGGEHTEAARLSDRFEKEAKAAIQSHIDEHYIGKGEAATPSKDFDFSKVRRQLDGALSAFKRGDFEQGHAISLIIEMVLSSGFVAKSEVEQRCIEARVEHLTQIRQDIMSGRLMQRSPTYLAAIDLELKQLSTNNKVALADVASPNPSPEAQRAIQGAVDRSMEIQRNIGKDTLERSE